MRIVTRVADLDHPVGVSTGLVPTMGAFHEGHIQLMRTARAENDRVIVSLFVNPTQFGKGEDYNRYPRDLQRDAELAGQAGVDILFTPSVSEVYPREGASIHVPVVTELWEGAVRPTHFAGVATVVCKLLNMVRCDVAYFGQKDLQQCLVIKRLIEDLNIPVRFSRQPTVRESDGLAMSSRNAYLSKEERSVAPILYKQLIQSKLKINKYGKKSSEIESALSAARATLSEVGFVVDYFDLIDLETTRPLRNLDQESALIAAARLGTTRLIDNVLM